MTIGTLMLLLLAQPVAAPPPPRAQELPTKTLAERQVKTLFDAIDANRDGKVNRSEANAFHAAQRAAAEARHREAGAAAFAKADTNKDGALSPQEFQGAARPIPDTKEVWFDVNDTDRNGQVDLAEATKRVLREFDVIDTNRDGTLTSQEISAASARQAAAARNARAAAPSPPVGR